MSLKLTLPAEVFSEGQSNLGLDCGGSVAKAVYLVKTEDGTGFDVQLYTFPRLEVDKFLEFLRGLREKVTGRVNATGGGIVQYRDEITESLGQSVDLLHEFACFINCFRTIVRMLPKHELVYDINKAGVMLGEKSLMVTKAACQYLADAVKKVQIPITDPSLPADFNKWTTEAVDQTKPYASADSGLYPCLLVILGSAAPLLKLEACGKTTLVESSPRAGRMLLSMASLFMGVMSFEELISLAEKGDSAKVDSVMSDYGPKLEDKTTTDIAKEGAGGASAKAGEEEKRSSAGDGEQQGKQEINEKQEESGYKGGFDGDYILFHYGKALGKDMGAFRREDVMRALLCHILSDLASVITKTAEGHGLERVFFAGSLITHDLVRRELTRCLSLHKIFSPKYNVEFNFLQHGGHYGALGALFNKTAKEDE